MSEKEFDKLFENVTPPDFIVPEAKAQLRRDLLNARQISARNSFVGLLKPKILLSAIGSVVVAALVLTVAFNPADTAARDLVKQVQSAYLSEDFTGKVHYLRFVFTALDREPIEYEQWNYPDKQQLRVQQRKSESGEICAHYICDRDETFTLRDSPFPRKYAFPSQENEASRTAATDVKRQKKQISIVIGPADDNRKTADGQRIMQAFIVNDAFDQEAFERQSPMDLIENLTASDRLRYVGTETDAETGEEVKILERRSAAQAFSLKIEFPEKLYGQVCWFCEQMSDQDISVSRDTPLGAFLSENNLEPELNSADAEAIERIKVYASTNKICETMLIIREAGEERYRAQKRFLTDEFVSYEPAIFAPEAYGLVKQDRPEQ